MKKIEGITTALITPFTTEGEVKEEAGGRDFIQILQYLKRSPKNISVINGYTNGIETLHVKLVMLDFLNP